LEAKLIFEGKIGSIEPEIKLPEKLLFWLDMREIPREIIVHLTRQSDRFHKV
jgi:hypothetical protein